MCEDVEAIHETAEILCDSELMRAIRQSIKEIESGDVEDLEVVLAELGWVMTNQ